jgi:hypothetical protein
MFILNQSTAQYYQIIEFAQQRCNRIIYSKQEARNIIGYVEDHHIIPKSLGGNNLPSNKVWLTAKEHFECHYLLTQMTSGSANGKMWSGLWRMLNKQSISQERTYEISSELYEEARIKHSNSHRESMLGPKNPFYGKTHSIETKEKMSKAKSGKSYEDIFGVEKAKEMKQKRRNEQLGLLKGKQTVTTCEYCGVSGGISVMTRWHGKNCKKSNSADYVEA